jgi:hypothetical protein
MSPTISQAVDPTISVLFVKELFDAVVLSCKRESGAFETRSFDRLSIFIERVEPRLEVADSPVEPSGAVANFPNNII